MAITGKFEVTVAVAALGVDISGGGAPFLTVNGLALVAEMIGRLGFFAPVTIFLEGLLNGLIGILSSRGMSNVLGMTLR